MTISCLLQLVNQLKVWHWQTTSYAQHSAFGAKYSSISDLVDSLVEVYQGKYGRVKAESVFKLELQNLPADCSPIVNSYIGCISGWDWSEQPDLANIQADLIIELNHLNYLLTLS